MRFPDGDVGKIVAALQRAVNVVRQVEDKTAKEILEQPQDFGGEGYRLWLQANGCLHSLRGLMETLEELYPGLAAVLEVADDC